VIPAVSTVPTLGGSPESFAESDLRVQSNFRTRPLPIGITQEIVDNPNVLLSEALADGANQGFKILQALTIQVDAAISGADGQTPPGAIGEIPFLGPNAEVASVSATFWLEQIANSTGATFLQLQYSQTVMLNFNGLSWPHVTVGTLVKAT
jgi:hypothetical protein